MAAFYLDASLVATPEPAPGAGPAENAPRRRGSAETSYGDKHDRD